MAWAPKQNTVRDGKNKYSTDFCSKEMREENFKNQGKNKRKKQYKQEAWNKNEKKSHKEE